MFILPINRDHRPPSAPLITLTLILINSLCWVIPTIMGINGRLIQTYGYRPAAPSLIALFCSMFLHVGLLHVAGNMWFLWMFAPKIEDRLGSIWFAVAYLACGLGGSGLHTLLSHHSFTPCVGASGAISGITGMYFVLFPRSPFELVLYLGWLLRKSFRAQTRGAIGAWAGEQLVLGLITSVVNPRGGGVAFWAHVGGFATGLLCAGPVLRSISAEERATLIRPTPLSAEEKEELFADKVEQASGLTTLKLN